MKIDDLGSLGGVAAPGAKGAGGVESGGRQDAGRGIDRAGSDRAELSGLAGKIAQATGIDAKQRAEKVERLRVEIAEGRYQPEASAISRGIVNESLSSPTSSSGTELSHTGRIAGEVTPAGWVALAAEARASVERVTALLERPTIEALDQSAAELLAATAQIQEIKDGGTSGGEPLKSMIAGLRKDLKRVGLLLRHAWALRVATSDNAGYSQRGELTAQSAPKANWILEG